MGAKTEGCQSCKKRKVKCDNTRPVCIRCQKAGIACLGFVQRVRFVHENARIRRSLASSQAQLTEFSLAKQRTRQAFPSAMPVTASGSEIFISFLFSKFFEGYHGRRCCGLPNTWANELVESARKPRHKSWDALAAIVFGQAFKREDVITNGLVLYGQALLQLRDDLSSPEDRDAKCVVASMTALYMYEMLWSKSRQGWMLHANGLGSMMELKGPWHQKQYAGTAIFLEHRIMLVAKSTIARQSTFLHNSIWKTVPWEEDPSSKDPADYLIDIGTDIAEYLAQIKKLHDNKDNHQQNSQYSQIMAQVAASVEQLNVWWQQWEPDHRPSAWEVPTTPTNIKSLFPTRLEYDTLWTAFTVSLYDTIRILLLQLLHRLECLTNFLSSAQNILETTNPTVLVGISSNTKALACEILRSLTDCYEKSPQLVGTFSFLFIQDVAYGCFDPGSEEAQWIIEHGWAAASKVSGAEDANLLKRLLPLGQIRLDRE